MRDFGPQPYGPRAGFAAHRARAPFLRRDVGTIVALSGGGTLRRCRGCNASVLEPEEAARPCPECGELPTLDHDDEGREQVHAAIGERLERGGLAVPVGVEP